MLIRDRFARILRATGLAACILFFGPGCWWQKDSYSSRMRDGFENFEKRAAREAMLGEAFQPAGDFPMWIRPPKPTSLVATPDQFADQFIAWFQGADAGGPLIEVILKGSAGAETLAEFQQGAFNALRAASKFPPQDPERSQEPPEITSMHDNAKMPFDLYQGVGQRQVPGAGGAAGKAAEYQWLIFVGEEQTQKILICFIVPTEKYVEFYRGPLTRCLESLALGGKVATASQTGGGAPAGG